MADILLARSDLHDLVHSILHTSGYQVRSFSEVEEALELLKSDVVDLVVTPTMAGTWQAVDLVRQMQSHPRSAPVLLVIEGNDDQLAAPALELGASSYVCADKLQQHLLETVRRVLAINAAGQGKRRLHGYLSRVEFCFELENDPSLVAPLVELIQENLARLGVFGESDRLRVGVAVEEAAMNSIYHGNLELTAEQVLGLDGCGGQIVEERRSGRPYCDRRVTVQMLVNPDQVEFTIRDQGPGFDPGHVPDPTDDDNLLRPSGRGLVMMRTMMDAIEYNSQGNEVRMVKRRNDR